MDNDNDAIIHLYTAIGLLFSINIKLDKLDRLWMNTLVGGTHQGAPDTLSIESYRKAGPMYLWCDTV